MSEYLQWLTSGSTSFKTKNNPGTRLLQRDHEQIYVVYASHACKVASGLQTINGN